MYVSVSIPELQGESSRHPQRIDYRITQGASERVQLEAMLASLALGE